MSSNAIPEGKLNGFPDNKRIITLILKYWYLFVISAIIAYTIVFFYLQITPKVYQGSLTILLESSKDKRITQSEMVEGFITTGESNNIDNQSLIIQSRNTIKKTISRLDFGISIFQNNHFLDRDLYGEAPFAVLIDSISPQILNTPIEIKFSSNTQFIAKIKSEEGVLYNFKEKRVCGTSNPLDFEQTIDLKEKLSQTFASFRIEVIDKEFNLINKEFYIIFNSNDDLIAQYAGSVNVAPLREGSSIITVSTRGLYPKKIARFLDELSLVYLEQNLEKKNDYANRTLGFIQKQLSQISDSLNKTRDQLMAFRAQNKFVNPSEFSVKISNEYFDLVKERLDYQNRLEFFENLKINLKNNPSSDDYLLPVITDDSNPFIATLSAELLKLNSELKRKEQYGSVSNPLISSIESDIENQKGVILQLIDKYIQSTKLKLETLRESQSILNGHMDNMPALERNYMDLERTYKLNDAIYTFLLQKQSETQISKSSNTPDNEVVDNARVYGPISPNGKQLTIQAIIFSLLLPLALIIAIDFFNNHIHTQEELKTLITEIPLIGVIPFNKSLNQNVLLNEPNSVISESFRTIRNKMRFMVTNSKFKVVTITSSNTGEGKTFCAINIATVFSLSGNKTALVGFDLRKPRLNEVFNHKDHKGISDYLVERATLDDIIFPSGIDNLTIIPSGPIPPNPSELILSERTTHFFNELRERYDVIIVDSPPIGIVSDTRILFDHSDTHLFVVRENYSRKDQVYNSLSTLIQEKISGMGLIYNSATSIGGKYGHGYYSQ